MKVYELLKDRKNWTQGFMARRADGIAVGTSDDNAVCWCLIGALYKCYRVEEVEKHKILLMRELTVLSLTNWNDHPKRKHSEIVAVLKKVNI